MQSAVAFHLPPGSTVNSQMAPVQGVPDTAGPNVVAPLEPQGQAGALLGAQVAAADEEAQPIPQQPGPGPRSFVASFLECVRGHQGGGPRPQCCRSSTFGMLAGTGLAAYGAITGEVGAVFVGAGVFAAVVASSLGVF